MDAALVPEASAAPHAPRTIAKAFVGFAVSTVSLCVLMVAIAAL
jgi:hypothetical protein